MALQISQQLYVLGRIHQHKENTADCNGDGGTEPLGELTQGVNHWYDQIMICG